MNKLMWAAAALVVAGSAQAAEVYGGVGTHGVTLGYAHALSPSFTLRGDFSTFDKINRRRVEDGVDYDATVYYNRTGLFADWFAFQGGFRLTGGVTFNNIKGDLVAKGNGTSMTIGNQTFVSALDDRLNVRVEFPKTTPYLGLGWGHQMSSGWGFTFDLGASIGKAKVTETHSGTNLGNTAVVSQADIDTELAQVRDGVGKVQFVPLIGIGLNYRF
jgi:hypothetical protein